MCGESDILAIKSIIQAEEKCSLLTLFAHIESLDLNFIYCATIVCFLLLKFCKIVLSFMSSKINPMIKGIVSF